MELYKLNVRLDDLEADIRQMKQFTGEMEVKIQELEQEAESIRDEIRDRSNDDDGPDDREYLWPGEEYAPSEPSENPETPY